MARPSPRCATPPSTVPPIIPATALARFHRAWRRSPARRAPLPLLVLKYPLVGGQTPGGVWPDATLDYQTPGVGPTHATSGPTLGTVRPHAALDTQTPGAPWPTPAPSRPTPGAVWPDATFAHPQTRRHFHSKPTVVSRPSCPRRKITSSSISFRLFTHLARPTAFQFHFSSPSTLIAQLPCFRSNPGQIHLESRRQVITNSSPSHHQLVTRHPQIPHLVTVSPNHLPLPTAAFPQRPSRPILPP
jgi:hypothetical protein